MLLIDGKIRTNEVRTTKFNKETQKYDITFDKKDEPYSYNKNRIKLLENPTYVDHHSVRITHKEQKLYNIKDIFLFSDKHCTYYHIRFENDSERDYLGSELQIDHTCLNDSNITKGLEYFKRIADLCKLPDESPDELPDELPDDAEQSFLSKEKSLLSKKYEALDFVSEDSALATYLSPNEFLLKSISENNIPIFPFGCNASQYKAVKKALKNQISVIEGPPGTGKTQTILNIIANLVINQKSVLIVSNNGSATDNIFEKLNSDKYNLGFLVARLGKKENKDNFIKSQTDRYPDLSSWNNSDNLSLQQIQECLDKLKTVFDIRERLADTRIQLQNLTLEKAHFDRYISESNIEHEVRMKKSIKSSDLINLWQECLSVAEKKDTIPFWVKLKGLIKYQIFDWKFYNQDISTVIGTFQKMYYSCKTKELTNEIQSLENDLSLYRADEIMTKLTDLSMKILKNELFSRYGNRKERKHFSKDELWKTPMLFLKEYPIVLSTTFSSNTALGKDAKYDYVIMDEASQVDVATGALALSCAKNAVIVGDKKQLPTIVKGPDAKTADAIRESLGISTTYEYSESNSFLHSICKTIPDAPQTLLREHYRCHPKIINFCNQKFYDGNLVIMTEDSDEPNVLSVMRTVKGNHARGHLNQRQIDVIKYEVLPKINFEKKDIGIIAPYKDQVEELEHQISDVDIATIHKFQGREKEAIIISTVDNKITDFTDRPDLLNVAVSRAEKQLWVIVHGNDEPKDSNICDLISYINYNNCSVNTSKIYSVFDLLYTEYTKSRIAFLKGHKRISEFDSENLMYALIEDILNENGFSNFAIICHQPLNMLIRDFTLLNTEETNYAKHPKTHLDFLIYNKITKNPILAIEVDGFDNHKPGTKQSERDQMKDDILELYQIPFKRFKTNGSQEKERLTKEFKQYLEKEIKQCLEK